MLTMIADRPKVIAVGGFSSDTGKTTLMCELLQAFPGWEAIKTTRGHYRSCGKDPHTCCVSHLLTDKPVLRSGRAQTYTLGKDTGRYWDAGAKNVHWVIATDSQLDQGIKQGLQAVTSEGVFVEGNSFSEYVVVDAMIMTVRESQQTFKRSAKRALSQAAALYVWPDLNPARNPKNIAESLLRCDPELLKRVHKIPIYTRETLSDLVFNLRQLKQRVAV